MTPTDEFNPNSWNAIIAAIMTRLQQGDSVMSDLKESIDELRNTLQCLPCIEHGEKIRQILEADRRRMENRTFRQRLADNSKAAIITSIISGAAVWIFTKIPEIVRAVSQAQGG